MLCLDDNHDTTGVQIFHHSGRDLIRQFLLDLGAAGICLNGTGKLAESCDLSVRQISDVHVAEEGEQMMLAD